MYDIFNIDSNNIEAQGWKYFNGKDWIVDS